MLTTFSWYQRRSILDCYRFDSYPPKSEHFSFRYSLVGAALSRECIAHECAPTGMSDMFDENL
jgi:hypothetical protein